MYFFFGTINVNCRKSILNFIMKRFFTFLSIFTLLNSLNAQAPAKNTAASSRPLWVGLDFGGTWQTSDMKPQAGIGWGITLSRYSKLDKKGPLYYGWRFRFLDGRSYGYNYHRLYGLDADPVLSAGATNYHTPTATNDGYVFSNYKFRFDEFAGEFIVGCNGLRKRGILLYGFGGLGFTHWLTMTNQLDANANKYDYSTVSTSGNDDIVQAELETIWNNGNYETVAHGSVSSGQWGLMPSLGFGMGYEFANSFAVGFEHRTTWALNDFIDGSNHLSNSLSTGSNDLYHYDGVFIRWTFGSNSTTDNSNTANTPRPPNPNNFPNNNPTPPAINTITNTIVPETTYPANYNQTTGPPPSVNFQVPSVNPYTATVPSQQLVIQVLNITASNQISLLVNNQANSNFSFNASTNTMVLTANFQNGTNVYQVTAANQFGSANDIQTINYGAPSVHPNSSLPPQVTITNPAANPFTSLVPTLSVVATVLNVTTVANVQVRRNGISVSNFSFDPNSHIVTVPASLSVGSNLYEVIGSNNFGSASDNVTLIYNPVVAPLPPVVTITSPVSCPYSVKTVVNSIHANITNVTTANQVSIVFNNQPITQFTFLNNGLNSSVKFDVTLLPGSNPFTITGTNAVGSNTKSCALILKSIQAPPAEVRPTVTILTPSANPHISTTSTFVVVAEVMNVTLANQITVKTLAGTNVPFTFNLSTHAVTFTANLLNGSNYYNVTATNSAGTASDNTTINYVATIPSSNPAPVTPDIINNNQATISPVIIILISPAAASSASSNQTLPVSMTVNGINASNEIRVRVNGALLSNFAYNNSTHLLTFNANLTVGGNTIEVRAQNSSGIATQVLTVTYAAPVQKPTPKTKTPKTTPTKTTPTRTITPKNTSKTIETPKVISKPKLL